MLEGRYYKSAERRKYTVAEAIDRYMEEILPEKSEIMQEKQRHQYLYWKDKIGHMLLCDLSPQVLSQERDELSKKLLAKRKKRSPANVNRYLAALSHMLTIASEEWGLISENSLLKVRRLSEPRGRTRFLSEDEVKRLLDACQNSEYEDLYCIVVVAMSTGARRSEIMNLTWNDVDIRGEFLQFNKTKNGEIRRVPIKGKALELLKEKRRVRRIDTKLVFPGKSDAPYTFRKPWVKALGEAQIEDFKSTIFAILLLHISR